MVTLPISKLICLPANNDYAMTISQCHINVNTKYIEKHSILSK